MNEIPTEKGLRRLPYQFETSVNFQKMLEIFLEEFDELATSAATMMLERSVETAQGVNLNNMGLIVGIERPIETLDTVGAFGFAEDINARGWGTLSDETVGGAWVSLGENQQYIDDALFRKLIKIQIVKNNITMTIESTIELIKFAFGGDVAVRYMCILNKKPIYEITHKQTFETHYAIKHMPTLIGLSQPEYIAVNNEGAFGFAEDFNARGWGTLSDEIIGGYFSSII
jgi:hypothetical protein